MRMVDDMEEAFEGAPVPRWLLTFATTPDRAIDDLLKARFHHGHLQAAEPEDLVLAWIDRLAAVEGFAQELDRSLAAWVERFWGRFPEAERPLSIPHAWRRLFEIIASGDGLPQTVHALRDRFGESRELLAPLSVSPSLDPLGRYYRALAEHQDDRSLAAHWWSMCAMPDHVPSHHGLYAVMGVTRMPARVGEPSGGFRDDVVQAVLRVSRGIDRRVEHGHMTKDLEASTLAVVAGWAFASLPFSDHWSRALAPSWQGLPERVQHALQGAIPALDDKRLRARRPAPSARRNWSQDTKSLVTRAKGRRADLQELQRFLAEARAVAEHTGDSTPLNRALCQFANLDSIDASTRVEWAEEARTWEPWNAFSWTASTAALQAAGRLHEALETAWETAERFPSNVVARTGLAEVLKARGRLDEAEIVYRDTVERFPSDVFARNGLAEVLKALGRLDEAEIVYRDTVERFPSDVVARTGLEGVTRARGNKGTKTSFAIPADQAILEAREPSASWGYAVRTPSETSPHSRLDSRSARILRREARRLEASSSPDPIAVETLRERARRVLDASLERQPNDLRVLTEAGLLLTESKALDDARKLLSEHASRLQGAPLVWASLARAVREGARAKGVRLDDDTVEDVLAAPHHLRDIGHAYEPLVRLQEGRAYLALTDGVRRLQGAARAFDRLRGWVCEHGQAGTDADFEHWYSAELHRHAFAGVDLAAKVTPTEVDSIAASIDANARFVDALEEDFVLRHM